MSDEKESGFCGRLLKFAAWCAAGFLGFVILLSATLPFWIGPVVTCVAGKIVPGYTGTDFSIDRFRFNPYSGVLGINGAKLSNPDGFGKAEAFSFVSFSAKVDVGSLISDTVLVKEIVVEDAFASYYSHDGKNNFDVIFGNVEKAMGSKEGKTGEKGTGNKRNSAKKKVIIERLRITGTKVKMMKSDMMPPFALPAIELTDVGKKSGGATLEEAWTQIVNSVMQSMSSAGDGIGALGILFGDGAKDLAGILNGGASGKKSKGAADAVGDTAKKAAEELKDIIKGFGK